MTLNKTWEECLRMWKWVSENWDGKQEVCNLKSTWLVDNGYSANEVEVLDNCFFCHYNIKAIARAVKGNPKRDGSSCEFCPGKKTESAFNCYGYGYCWHRDPKAFYAKLVELNKLRNAAPSS